MLAYVDSVNQNDVQENNVAKLTLKTRADPSSLVEIIRVRPEGRDISPFDLRPARVGSQMNKCSAYVLCTRPC